MLMYLHSHRSTKKEFEEALIDEINGTEPKRSRHAPDSIDDEPEAISPTNMKPA